MSGNRNGAVCLMEIRYCMQVLTYSSKCKCRIMKWYFPGVNHNAYFNDSSRNFKMHQWCSLNIQILNEKQAHRSTQCCSSNGSGISNTNILQPVRLAT